MNIKNIVEINSHLWIIDGYFIRWVNGEYFSVSKFDQILFRTDDFETAVGIVQMLNTSSGRIKLNGKFYNCLIKIEPTAWNADMITIHLPETVDATNWYHSVRLVHDLPPCFQPKF